MADMAKKKGSRISGVESANQRKAVSGVISAASRNGTASKQRQHQRKQHNNGVISHNRGNNKHLHDALATHQRRKSSTV